MELNPLSCIFLIGLIKPDVPQILINREPLNKLQFDVELYGNCDDVICELCNELGGEWLNLIGSFVPKPLDVEKIQEIIKDSNVEGDEGDENSDSGEKNNLSENMNEEKTNIKTNYTGECEIDLVGFNSESVDSGIVSSPECECEYRDSESMNEKSNSTDAVNLDSESIVTPKTDVVVGHISEKESESTDVKPSKRKCNCGNEGVSYSKRRKTSLETGKGKNH